ncbi:hypothetical protein ACIBBD_02860 [Streptomyces sp. NPDC051315]|uniref:hypothetical protein n=1 Tax=Streptomyces sp. NPDC051315 TaxID=3365650 RepID=UPI00379F3BB9
MTAAVGTGGRSLWSHPELALRAVVDAAGSVRLGTPGQDRACPLPLVEVTATGHGRLWSGERLIETAIGDRLACRGHETVRDGRRERTTIRLADTATGLAADVMLETAAGAGHLRARARLVNEGGTPLRLESVTTLAPRAVRPSRPRPPPRGSSPRIVRGTTGHPCGTRPRPMRPGSRSCPFGRPVLPSDTWSRSPSIA